MRDKLYHIITYGCQMNVHESEKIAGILSGCGYLETGDIHAADVIIFNTCCIRENAEHRAYGNIGALKGYKRERPSVTIGVVGCMTQQPGAAEALIAKFPFVDIVLGTHNLHKLGDYLRLREGGGRSVLDVWKNEGEIVEDVPVVRSSGPNAWVNIMVGCNNFCTYCIVPYVRGRERSRQKKVVLAEIEQLLSEGYREITLLGQNVNSYGKDLEGDATFSGLIADIASLPGKFRLRFMTSHPKDLTDDVIDAVAKYDKICKCIHLPVQSGSTRVLAAMNRRYTAEQYLDLAARIKAKVPGVQLTTDVMVGFPGETEEDFEATLRLVREVEFSNAFTFVYSRRSGTVADKMPDQIPEDVKKRRIAELIRVQNGVTERIGKSYLGNAYEVLVESEVQGAPGRLVGRTDCGRLVSFEGGPSLVGTFCDVRVTESDLSQSRGVLLCAERSS